MTSFNFKITGWREALVCVFLAVFAAQASAQSLPDGVEATEKARIREIVVNGIKHPGIGLDKQLLEDARAQVLAKRDPWYSGFVRFAASPRAAKDVTSRNQSKTNSLLPDTDAFDNGGVEGRLKVDADTALRQALMYWFTGEAVYRANAMRIVRLWSKMDPDKFKAYREVYIHCSPAFKDMIVVAELLRSMNSPNAELAWTGADTAAFSNNFVVPGVKNFFDHNGWFMNQNGFTYMPAIAGAIFRSDPQDLAKRVERFTVNKTGPNKGTSFSIHDLARLVDTNALTGEKVAQPQVQITEMGRDQAHSGDDTMIFTTIGRILNSQGVKVDPKDGTISKAPDAVGVYEFLDDRILTAVEHFSRFMLGHDTPWIPTPSDKAPDGTVRQIYSRIADNYRGRIRQHRMWDLYYYYTYVKGVDLSKKAPYYHETYLKRIVSSEYEWIYIPKQARGDALRIPPSEQEPAVVEFELRSSNLDGKSASRTEGDTTFMRVNGDPEGARVSVLSCANESKTVGLRIRTNGVAEIELSGFGKPWLLPNTRGEWRQVFYTLSALERFGDIVFFNVKAASGTTVDLDQFLRRPEPPFPAFVSGAAPLRLVAYVGAPVRLDFSATPGSGGPVKIGSLDLPEGAALDADTGMFSWKPAQIGERVFVVEASDGVTVAPKKVTISVVADRAAALAAIKTAYDDKTTYVTSTLDRFRVVYAQAESASKTASDADFFARLVELKAAFDALAPLTPLLPDGTMDFPKVVVASNIGAVATNLLVDGNDDTFVGFYLAPDGYHEFDFGPDFKFSATAFALEGRVNFEDRVDNTQFYGSNDHVNWTELSPERVLHATELKRVAVASELTSATFRYLRVWRKGGSIEPSEMRIYGRRHESGNQLSAVSLSSEKNNGIRIALGERARLTIQAREPVQNLRALIQGVEATVRQTGEASYVAEAVLRPGQTKAGPLQFCLDYRRRDGKPGDTAHVTTDGSRLVVVDETKLIANVPGIVKIIDPNTGAVSRQSQRMLDALFDNNPDTYSELNYQGRGDNAYLVFDFGPARRVQLSGVELLARSRYRERLAGAVVEGSQDGNAWATLTEGAGETVDWQSLRMKPSVRPYRYLRIFNRKAWHCNLGEVRFHGDVH